MSRMDQSKSTWLLTAMLLLSASLVACGGGESVPPPKKEQATLVSAPSLFPAGCQQASNPWDELRKRRGRVLACDRSEQFGPSGRYLSAGSLEQWRIPRTHDGRHSRQRRKLEARFCASLPLLGGQSQQRRGL